MSTTTTTVPQWETAKLASPDAADAMTSLLAALKVDPCTNDTLRAAREAIAKATQP